MQNQASFFPQRCTYCVLQSKPAAIIYKLLNNMRTIKHLAHWARGGTWNSCCLFQSISASVMVRNQMLILLHMFMWQGNMPFLSFLASKKETKTRWENNGFMGKVCTYKCTPYLGRELWFLDGWIKAPLDYWRTKPRCWENSEWFWIDRLVRVVTVGFQRALSWAQFSSMSSLMTWTQMNTK